MKNQWKSAFFILLAIMIIVPIIVVSLIFVDQNGKEGAGDASQIEGEPVFTIHSTKEELNFLIKEKLKELKSDSGKFDYDVQLGDKVTVDGYFTFFSDKVAFTMDFQPEVQKNGNLLLKEESIKIGALSLPGEKILEFIKGSTDLPEWVEINDEKETILIKLTQIEVRDDLFLKAESFDLKNDDIRFKMYYKTK